jgi:tellurite resistance protein
MVDSSERNRSPEAEYFYKKEQELIAKLRQKAEAEARKKGLGEAVGVENEQILAVLDEMGYDRETVFLLFLIPLLQVAWSDGKLSEKERALILEVGHTYGVKEGHAAYQKLQGWLTSKPSKETFDRALTVIRNIMSFQTWEQRETAAQKLVEASERIAAASGGFLGLGSKVSAEEKAVLRRVAAAIETAHADTAPKLLDDIGT